MERRLLVAQAVRPLHQAAGAALRVCPRLITAAGFMIVIEHIYNHADLPEDARSYARDTLTLGWEDRTQARGRRHTDGGVEFATSLPRGTVLRAGDCFVLDNLRLVVTVMEQREPVFVIQPRAPAEWALYAYHIGNRHQPLMITDAALVCPDLPGVEQLLEQHRMPYVRQMQAFTPAALVTRHSH
jgi:urease accessory protein UreE